MLPKHRRLNLKTEFRKVASGKRIDTNLFTLFYNYGENQEAKIGISLSKKQFRLASERNKAKRVVAKIIESKYARLRNDLNLVIMPKASVLVTSPEDFVQAIENIPAIYK